MDRKSPWEDPTIQSIRLILESDLILIAVVFPLNASSAETNQSQISSNLSTTIHTVFTSVKTSIHLSKEKSFQESHLMKFPKATMS